MFKQAFSAVVKVIGEKLNKLLFRKFLKNKKINIEIIKPAALPAFFESQRLRTKESL